MAEGFGYQAGGIFGLVDLLEDPESSGPIEYDLIALGLRLDMLGTDRLDWRDLLVIVEQSSSESARSRSQREGWTDMAMLLAAAIDTLRVLAWQQTEDGSKGRNQPEPIPRPGVKASGDKQTLGKSDGFDTKAELNAWYQSRFKQN